MPAAACESLLLLVRDSPTSFYWESLRGQCYESFELFSCKSSTWDPYEQAKRFREVFRFVNVTKHFAKPFSLFIWALVESFEQKISWNCLLSPISCQMGWCPVPYNRVSAGCPSLVVIPYNGVSAGCPSLVVIPYNGVSAGCPSLVVYLIMGCLQGAPAWWYTL